MLESMDGEKKIKKPDKTNVIHGRKIIQTRKANWLCLDNIYQKLQRPNFYDIGGTYVQDVAEYWFMYKTEQTCQITLLHLFVCNKQESQFVISISRDTDNMYIDGRLNAVYLTLSLKEHRFNKTKEKSQNYVTTYNFSNYEIDVMKNRTLYIAVSFSCCDYTGDLNLSEIEQVKLRHDFGELLKDPFGSDFVIESSDGTQFKVHRILLATQSEVFKAMLKEETAESQKGFVKFVDVSKEDVKCMLEFIYTGTIKDMAKCKYLNMLRLADRYNLNGLKELSQYALAQHLSIDNFMELFLAADMYNSVVLKNAALKFVRKHSSEIQLSFFRNINDIKLVHDLYEHMIAP